MNQSAFIRTLPSVLIFLFGVGIAYFEYFDLSNSTEKDFRIRFNLDAGSRISAIKREVGFGLEAISAVRAFYASSHKVERNEFQNFSESLIAGQTTIQALEWIPRIKHDERAAYENLARMDGIVNFTIREKNELGKIVPASIRDEYFPIFFIAPVAGNETALGYDLASNPIRRNMLWRARDMNQMIASPPIQLVQDQNDDEISILVADPVYKNDIPVTDMAARRNHLIGFIVGAFHVRDLVQIALDYSGSAEIDFHLFDESSSDGTKLLYRYVSYPDHPETYRVTENTIYSLIDYHYSEQFSVADRVWRIVAIPSPAYLKFKGSILPLLVAEVIIISALFLSYWVWKRLNEAAEVEKIVRIRTAQLMESKEELERNIEVRIRTEKARDKLIHELKEALANVKTLTGLLPICYSCKKVRDDKGYWDRVDTYFRKHSNLQFSHGLCPDCAEVELKKIKKQIHEGDA